MLGEHCVCLIQRTVTRAFPEASVLCEISLNHNINHYSDIVILQGSRLTSKTFPSFHHIRDTFILLPFILFNIYIHTYMVRINHQTAAITLEHRHFHQRFSFKSVFTRLWLWMRVMNYFAWPRFYWFWWFLLFSLQTLRKVICLCAFKADIVLPGYKWDAE